MMNQLSKQKNLMSYKNVGQQQQTLSWRNLYFNEVVHASPFAASESGPRSSLLPPWWASHYSPLRAESRELKKQTPHTVLYLALSDSSQELRIPRNVTTLRQQMSHGIWKYTLQKHRLERSLLLGLLLRAVIFC